MATIFSHALVGCTVLKLAPKKYQSKISYLVAGLTAILPDIDYLGYVSHIPYDSFWGHRGFSHSLVFALLAAVLAGLAIARKINTKFIVRFGIFFDGPQFKFPQWASGYFQNEAWLLQ